MQDTKPAQETPAPPPTRPWWRRLLRRWWRRLAALGLVLGLLYLFRAPLLTALGGLLIADDGEAPAAGVLLLDADGQDATAAGLYHRGRVAGILWVSWSPNRVDRLAILPPAEERVRKQLVDDRGVPAEAVSRLVGAALDHWEVAEAVRTWLDAHPGTELLICCNRFGSRRLRTLFDRVLGERACRVRLLALPSRSCNESNWWQSQQGLLEFWQGAAGLAHVTFAGRGEDRPPAWDPDAYERSLR